MTAGEAIAHGADWVVVGRPIRDAADPAAAARAIAQEARAALAARTASGRERPNHLRPAAGTRGHPRRRRKARARHGPRVAAPPRRRRSSRRSRASPATTALASSASARAELDRVSRGRPPPGRHRVRVRAPRHAPRTTCALDDRALVVALDEIQDPQNFGAVIRSAVAMSASAVVWPEHRSAPLSPATFRASAGAIEHATLCRVSSLPPALESLRERGLFVVGLDANGPALDRPRRPRPPRRRSSSAPRARDCARRSSARAIRSRGSRCPDPSDRSTRRSPSPSRSTSACGSGAPREHALGGPPPGRGCQHRARRRPPLPLRAARLGVRLLRPRAARVHQGPRLRRRCTSRPTAQAWLLGVALGASGIGGIVGGALADRVGKRTMLAWTVLIYSLGSLVCGLAPNVWVFVAGRAIVGLGRRRRVGHRSRHARRGGAAGAPRALVGGAAVGRAAGRRAGGRGRVPGACRAWAGARSSSARAPRRSSRSPRAARCTCRTCRRATAGACAPSSAPASAGASRPRGSSGVFKLGTYWTCYTWLPSFLREMHQPIARSLAWMLTAQIGQLLGHADVRRRVGPARAAPGLRDLLGGHGERDRAAGVRLGALSPPRRLFWATMFVLGVGSGCTAGFGALLAELFPTEVRGVAMGTTYNLARGAQLLRPGRSCRPPSRARASPGASACPSPWRSRRRRGSGSCPRRAASPCRRSERSVGSARRSGQQRRRAWRPRTAGAGASGSRRPAR